MAKRTQLWRERRRHRVHRQRPSGCDRLSRNGDVSRWAFHVRFVAGRARGADLPVAASVGGGGSRRGVASKNAPTPTKGGLLPPPKTKNQHGLPPPTPDAAAQSLFPPHRTVRSFVLRCFHAATDFVVPTVAACGWRRLVMPIAWKISRWGCHHLPPNKKESLGFQDHSKKGCCCC